MRTVITSPDDLEYHATASAAVDQVVDRLGGQYRGTNMDDPDVRADLGIEIRAEVRKIARHQVFPDRRYRADGRLQRMVGEWIEHVASQVDRRIAGIEN